VSVLDTARLSAKLAGVKGRQAIGSVLVETLIEVCSADAALAWLPQSSPDGTTAKAVFGAGFVGEIPAEELDAAARSEGLAEWLAARGAGFSLESGDVTTGRIALSWRARPSVDPGIISMVLDLVSGQVSALLEQERLAEDVASLRTALEEAEGQMARTRRARAVGEMALGIAHDFNNCLTTILGFTELALGPLNESDPYYTDLATIRIAALDAAALV